MTIIEKEQIKWYHRTRIRTWAGNTVKIQGWTSKAMQKRRFNEILDHLDFRGASVLDVGCGYGDFKTHLDMKYPKLDYIGIDQQKEFVADAKERFAACNNAWFYHTDFSRCQLPRMDVVVACGVLSYYTKDPNYYFDMIHKFYKVSKRTLVFNMLDETYFDSGSLIVAHNRNLIYQFCKQICKNVQLIQRRDHNFFTVIMSAHSL